MIKRMIPFAHDLLSNTIENGDVVIDATCGNGNDTLFLCELVGEAGHVYAFDVQATAIENSKVKTIAENFENVTYVLDSHAMMDTYIPENLHGNISGAIFNLGYLPRSDKKIITQPTSTIEAIEKSLDFLKMNGLVIVVVYHGHEGGTEEKDSVIQFTENLAQEDYAVLKYQFINQRNNPPFVIAIQKR